MRRTIKKGISIIKGIKPPMSLKESIKEIDRLEDAMKLNKDYLKEIENSIKITKDTKTLDILKDALIDAKDAVKETEEELYNIKINQNPFSIKPTSSNKKGGKKSKNKRKTKKKSYRKSKKTKFLYKNK